ncbi:hypothetical protein COLE_04545 [Cutaneotrichosporon oleaginosum]|nr:hypothetical protein COLE_04545 [Cutaneotrichosporon oleaginosum]
MMRGYPVMDTTWLTCVVSAQ